MRRLMLLLTLALALTFAARAVFAATPPPIPPDRLQPAVPPAPDPLPVPPPQGGVRVPSFALETLRNSHLSGVVYYGIFRSLQHATGTSSAPVLGLSSLGHAEVGVRILKPTPDAIFLSEVNATSDPLQDVEPSVITINENPGGTPLDRTVTSYIKYEDSNTPRIHYASTTDFSLFIRGSMPIPLGYNVSGDPLMSENPYPGGIAALRRYCAGLVYNNNDLRNPQNYPNAIGVWHSDMTDNGYWTANPAIADSRPSGYFLDKPAIAVSLHNGGDLGYVYLAYVSQDYVNSNSAIVVALSTNGGATFPQKTVVAYGPLPTPQNNNGLANPQIVVDPGTGTVYVLWVDFGARNIQMAASTNFGAGFGAHEIAGTGVHIGSIPPGGSPGLRAETAPMARFDWYTNPSKIILTWHADGTSGTDILYAYRDTSGWHRVSSTPTTGVQFTANDQFMPAIDFNTLGNVVITYYDRHADNTNTSYRTYEAYLTPTGTRIDATDQDLSRFDSTPPLNSFIGDYQDVWDWPFSGGEKATSSWVGISAGTFDIWLSRIGY
jgi:hypothetical protein